MFKNLKNHFNISKIYHDSLSFLDLDAITRDHSYKVSQYACLMASTINPTCEFVNQVFVAAFLHDIGKSKIPQEIINKPGRLTKEEWELIRQHPAIGSNIVKANPALSQFTDIILYHHERFDGEGYPYGLKGKEIPLVARIISIADSFDAMTSVRPYKGKLDIKCALNELIRCSGTQFDPDLVNCFVNLFL